MSNGFLPGNRGGCIGIQRRGGGGGGGLVLVRRLRRMRRGRSGLLFVCDYLYRYRYRVPLDGHMLLACLLTWRCMYVTNCS